MLLGNQRPTTATVTLRSLVLKLPAELAETCAGDMPRELAVRHHPAHVQILDRDPSAVAGERVGELVQHPGQLAGFAEYVRGGSGAG